MTLEISRRRLMGEDLESCSLDELQQLEHQLEKGLANVKAKKNAVLVECIERLQEAEKVLSIENAQLKKKIAFTKNKPRYIPAELWPGILCNLPVKSLLRFRCVSKSWQSLIEDPELARLHLKSFKNNRDETHLLVVQGEQRNCVVKHSDTFETSSGTLLSLGYGYRSKQATWDIVCSVDGLVLLKRTTSGPFKDLKVWNPSTRKFHEFPSLPKIEASPKDYFRDVDIGLGYDPSANAYKHVKLICVYDRTQRQDHSMSWHSFAVHNLNTGSWKMIPFQGTAGCSGHWDRVSIGRNVSVYLQGSLYFIPRDANDYQAWELVSFDLSSEVFSYINMPEYANFAGWNNLVLVDGGCSLAVFDASRTTLWVLESESMSWTKRHSFYKKMSFHQFWYFKRNGHVLTQKACSETFTDETGNITVKWDEVVSYDPETKELKTVQGRGSSLYPITRVSAYVESLILLK